MANGFNLIASPPADVFLTERLAQLQSDLIIVDAESDARDAPEQQSLRQELADTKPN